VSAARAAGGAGLNTAGGRRSQADVPRTIDIGRRLSGATVHFTIGGDHPGPASPVA
jgi:hypothetical protein